MYKDRGMQKWYGFMLTEHTVMIGEQLIEDSKVKKPELDEQAIEEFELIICEAMEFNNTIVLEIFDNGFINTIAGTVHYINHLKSQLILQDKQGYFHHIPFSNLINVYQK